MKDLSAILLGYSQREAAFIEKALRSQIPSAKIEVEGASLDNLTETINRNYQLVFVDLKKDNLTRIDQLKRTYPLANILLTDMNGEANGKVPSEMVSSLVNGQLVDGFFPYPGKLETELGNQIDQLRRKGKLKRSINVYLIGSGKFAQGFIKILKHSDHWGKPDSFVEKVGLYSASAAAERRGFGGNSDKFRYEDIRRNAGLDDVALWKNKFFTFDRLGEWASAASKEADVVLFMTGPNITNYEAPAEKIRGKESGPFEKYLFENTFPRLIQVCTGLRETGFNENSELRQFWTLYNPIDPLSILAVKFLGNEDMRTYSSPTPGGIRTAKFLAGILSRMPTGGKLSNLSYLGFEKLPILGRHASPEPYLEEVEFKGNDGQIHRLMEFYYNDLRRIRGDLTTKLKKDLREKAVKVMVSATQSGVEFLEAPDAL